MHEDLKSVEYIAPAPPAPPEGGRRAVGWGISSAIHGCAIVAMTFVVWANKQPDFENVVLRTEPPMAPVKEPRRDPPSDLHDRVLVEVPVESPDEPVETPTAVLVTTPDELTSEETSNPEAGSSGDPTNAVDMAMSPNVAAFTPAIGPGSSAPGKIGNCRPDGGPKRAKQKQNHASRDSVDAVKRALRWLKRHQSSDGSWQAEQYFRQCDGTERCEPGKDQGPGTTEALTAYAVLCFLGDGYDHKTPSMYQPTVALGIKRMLAMQQADGSFGARNYEHAIATMTLAQAYAQTNDPALQAPVTRATQVILARQNQTSAVKGSGSSPGLGWDYSQPSDRNDTSVTGWNVMALKSAMIAGIPGAEKGLQGTKAWLDEAWKAANPAKNGSFSAWKDATAYDQTRFPYCWYPAKGTVDMSKDIATGNGGAQSMESVGLLCAAFTGKPAGDPLYESLANSVAAHQAPKTWPCNTYYLYYNTLAIFQVGGKRWDDWNGQVRDLLVTNQRRDGCFEGSWDWQGTVFHGNEAGRVLSTVYTTLSLEVYWLYDRIHPEKAKAQR